MCDRRNFARKYLSCGSVVARLVFFLFSIAFITHNRKSERIISTMSHHEAERFIPIRKKLDQISLVKDYATIPRLEYR